MRGRRVVEEDIETGGTERTGVGVQYAGGAKMVLETSVEEKVQDERASGETYRASAARNTVRWLFFHRLRHQNKQCSLSYGLS